MVQSCRRNMLTILLILVFIGSEFLVVTGSAESGLGDDLGQSNMAIENSIIIKLKTASIDPLREEPAIPETLRLPEMNGYYLVQLNGPVQSEWVDELKALGVRPLGYVPDYTYVTHMDDGLVDTLRGLSFVRWIGGFHPYYKISQYLEGKTGILELNIVVFEDGNGDNLVRVADRIRALNGIITYDGESNSIIRARIDSSRIADVAFIPEVAWIDEYSDPVVLMDNIRNFTGANEVETGGFNGSGIVGEVKDSGWDEDHPEFEGQVAGVDGFAPVDAHGTATFGEVFSSGANYWKAKGMLPGAQGVFAHWGIGRLTSIANLVNNWGGLFQSNSWHSGFLNGSYSAFSKENDQAVFDYDVTMLYAAGNGGGTQTISQEASAKNVISVGALLHFDNTWLTDDWHVSGYSGNQGPTEDWRIKPDICGPYDAIFTTDISGPGGYTTSDYVSDFGGTSGATPVAAGAVGLIYQMYMANHFDNNPSGAMPHAATVKAILIANAYQYDFAQADRFEQGWGLVDIGKVYDTGRYHFIVDQGVSLQTATRASYDVISIGTQPLKITLVWTDPPALPNSNPALVNDLHLKVTSPNGTMEYWGNEGLTTGKWSVSGNTRDNLNNVENVFIENPNPYESWKVEVIAENIGEDGNLDTPEMDQHFALVVSGGYADDDPPVTILSASGTLGDNNWYVSNVTMTLNSYDEMSGIAFTNYSIDGSLWNTYTGPFIVDTDGEHTVEYYAMDEIGNVEDIKSFSMKIDTAPPVFSSASPLYDVTYDSYMDPVRLQLNWNDSASGVSYVELRYRFDYGPWSGWDPPDGSSGDTHWLNVPRSEWIEHVGSRLEWESAAVDNAGLTKSTPTINGTQIEDDDTAPPSPSNPFSDGTVDDSNMDPYRIGIDWNDISGISEVRFKYTNDTVSWSPWLNHSGSSASTYWYDIPRSIWIDWLDSEIYWQSKAVDGDDDRPSDSLVNTTVTQLGGFIVDDDIAPPLGTNFYSEGNVSDSYNESYRIQLDWEDYSGISDVEFRYSNDTLNWSAWSNHTGSSGSTYWYDIPRSIWIDSLDSAIYWQSKAVDDDDDRPNDSLGNMTATQLGGFIFDDDTAPPLGTNFCSEGDILDSLNDAYRIQIDWEDYSGISNVEFRYSNDAVTWSAWSNHTGTSGSTYWYDIPRSVWIDFVGSWIYWQSRAMDNDDDRIDDNLGNTTEIHLGGSINDDDLEPPVVVEIGTEYNKSTTSFDMFVEGEDASGWMLYVQYYYTNPFVLHSLSNLTLDSAPERLFVTIEESELRAHSADRIYWRYRLEDFDNDRDSDSLGTPWSHWIKTIILDFTPPTTKYYLRGDAGFHNWFVSSVCVTLIPEDDGSGVYVTTYRVDGGEWLAYGEPFEVVGSGVHYVEFYSIDNAGNVELINSLMISIDNTRPIANATVDLETSVGSTVMLDGNGSVDDFSIGTYDWSIEKSGKIVAVIRGAVQYYVFDAAGHYNVTLTVTDHVGNTDQTVIWVEVTALPESSPQPWWVLGLLMPIVIIFLLLVFIMMRRRRDLEGKSVEKND